MEVLPKGALGQRHSISMCMCSQNEPETDISFSSACTAHAWFDCCCGQEFNKVWKVGVWGCQTPRESWSKTNHSKMLRPCVSEGLPPPSLLPAWWEELGLVRNDVSIASRWGMGTWRGTERNTVPVATISASGVCSYPTIVQTNQTALKLEYKWIQCLHGPAFTFGPGSKM